MQELHNKIYTVLTLPNDILYLRAAVSFVNKFAQKIGFTNKELHEIDTGVTEAVINVIEHAFEPDEKAIFEITCEKLTDGIAIEITEQGIPFDPDIIQFNEDNPEQMKYKPGYGLFLIRKNFDKVEFLNLGKKGKKTSLIKHFSSHCYNQTNLVTNTETEKDAVINETIDFQIRQLEPDDAIEISRCAYKTYGYSYVAECIYYPDRMIDLNRNNEIYSAVAVAKKNNDVMGHIALTFYDRIAEMGMGFVKPEYRKQNCFKNISLYLIEKAKELKLHGLFTQSVTNHTFSQKAAHSFGIADCGIILGGCPTTVSFKKISEKLIQRESFLISFLSLKKEVRQTIYPPKRHKTMILDIFNHLGIDTDSKQCRSEWQTENSRKNRTAVKVKLLSYINIAKIEIDQAGSDIWEIVEKKFKALKCKKVDVILLYISLENSTAEYITERAEAAGFFFSGIFPHTRIGNALVLQYLNNVYIDYSRIKLESDFALKILDYIQQKDPNRSTISPIMNNGFL